MNYYNENDPEIAVWLQHLIDDGLIPAGHVDTRCIRLIQAGDLDGYTQHHFFAGIGGWAAALQLSRWPAAQPVWSGSCPCQSYSIAGKQRGADDPRHLWPVWFKLIKQHQPDVIFGEQVANAIRHGWLDGVSTDLEAESYAVGHAVLGAHSVNSPHQRQRLWFVANRLPDAKHQTRPDQQFNQSGRWGSPGPECESVPRASGSDGGRRSRMGDAISEGSQRFSRHGNRVDRQVREETEQAGSVSASGVQPAAWDSAEWVNCEDGRKRRIKPGIEPLVDGLPGQVALLRGAGNAIVPQVGAMFVNAFLDVSG